MSERGSAAESSGACERSKLCGATERVSSASERVNRRASGPVLQSVFLVILAHSALEAAAAALLRRADFLGALVGSKVESTLAEKRRISPAKAA